MKQEFVTLYGKAIIENNILHLRQTHLPFSKTTFAKIGFELVILAAFLLQFWRTEGPKKYIGILIYGFLVLLRGPVLYDIFLRRSYSNRIPMEKIDSLDFSEDSFGMETYVTLTLKNGRSRKIAFRKLEHQYEGFIEAVNLESTQLKAKLSL